MLVLFKVCTAEDVQEPVFRVFQLNLGLLSEVTGIAFLKMQLLFLHFHFNLSHFLKKYMTNRVSILF